MESNQQTVIGAPGTIIPAEEPSKPNEQRTTASFGGYEFPLLELDPLKHKIKADSMVQALFVVLAYMDHPKVNEAMTAYGFQIADANGKFLFPRRTT